MIVVDPFKIVVDPFKIVVDPFNNIRNHLPMLTAFPLCALLH